MAAAASAEALVRVPVERAYRVTVGIDPSAGFYPRFGPLPAVESVTDRSGAFDSIGDTRMLHLSDGGTVRETVVVADAPRRHAYRLTEFTGLFGALVHHADAEWTFSSQHGGTRVRWTYSFTARRNRSAIVWSIVRLAWAPYMRRVLPGIAHEIARTA